MFGLKIKLEMKVILFRSWRVISDSRASPSAWGPGSTGDGWGLGFLGLGNRSHGPAAYRKGLAEPITLVDCSQTL
jgi:hypothetical protein